MSPNTSRIAFGVVLASALAALHPLRLAGNTNWSDHPGPNRSSASVGKYLLCVTTDHGLVIA